MILFRSCAKIRADGSWGVEFFITFWLWFSYLGILCYSFLYSYGDAFHVFAIDTNLVVDL